MRFNLDEVMGIHESALYLRSRRTSVLATNLANEDTPNYKARDVDFKKVLRQFDSDKIAPGLMKTNAKHLSAAGQGVWGGELLYRTPLQPSLDNNTVDGQIEKAQFSQNTLQYQATLTFLNGKISGIMAALAGGQ